MFPRNICRPFFRSFPVPGSFRQLQGVWPIAYATSYYLGTLTVFALANLDLARKLFLALAPVSVAVWLLLQWQAQPTARPLWLWLWVTLHHPRPPNFLLLLYSTSLFSFLRPLSYTHSYHTSLLIRALVAFDKAPHFFFSLFYSLFPYHTRYISYDRSNKMHSSSGLVALAAFLSTASAATFGFNYGSTFADQSAKVESDFAAEFAAAKKLPGVNGAFTSARLYTMIVSGDCINFRMNELTLSSKRVPPIRSSRLFLQPSIQTLASSSASGLLATHPASRPRLQLSRRPCSNTLSWLPSLMVSLWAAKISTVPLRLV